jgi:hypothetical protein
MWIRREAHEGGCTFPDDGRVIGLKRWRALQAEAAAYVDPFAGVRDENGRRLEAGRSSSTAS